jgi:hypothetical protein
MHLSALWRERGSTTRGPKSSPPFAHARVRKSFLRLRELPVDAYLKTLSAKGRGRSRIRGYPHRLSHGHAYMRHCELGLRPGAYPVQSMEAAKRAGRSATVYVTSGRMLSLSAGGVMARLPCCGGKRPPTSPARLRAAHRSSAIHSCIWLTVGKTYFPPPSSIQPSPPKVGCPHHVRVDHDIHFASIRRCLLEDSVRKPDPDVFACNCDADSPTIGTFP